MGIFRCKSIRFECDSDEDWHSDIYTFDISGQSYPEMIKRAKENEGWVEKEGLWYCPYCAIKLDLINNQNTEK